MGPAGTPGGGTPSFQIAVSTPSASWLLAVPGGIGRPPQVQVFLTSGEQILTDVYATAATVNVVFAAPATGYVILS
jgi:hypothetical protein